MKQFDLIIIGAGRASNLAITASKKGKKVALIEKSKLGGTCPNRGCVPSKLLIGYANVARSIKESKRHFIDSTINNIDINKIFEEINHYVDGVDNRYNSRMDENIEVFKGIGSFVSNNTVRVNDQELTAPNIVIATGTRPISALHNKAWTSDNIFPLKKDIPKSISIVGSGFIACELANFFDAIGIQTKLLVRGETLLSNEDYDISNILKEQISKTLDIEFNATIKEVDYKNEEFKLILENKNGTSKAHTSQALLYTTGRKANTDTLNLQNTDIQIDKKGFIKRDDFFETTVKGIYVVGDAAGKYMLQHAAAYEVNHLGKILFENEKKPLIFKYMPHAVFTDPEIASVGITEQKAKEEKIEYIANTTDWLASAKAMSMKIKYPRTKFIVDPNNYKILGCHMIGPDSATMIHQILSILHIDNDIRHLKEMLYIHPALSESLLPAAVDTVKKIEQYNENKKEADSIEKNNFL